MQPLPQRKSPRLHGYDYRREGAYFVTICTHNRVGCFGEVVGEQMALATLGEIAHSEILTISHHWTQVDIDAFVVMPNHIHMIVVIDQGKAANAMNATDAMNGVPTGKPPTLGEIVGKYKAGVTRKARERRVIEDGYPLRQSRYHDHVIRNEADLARILNYVEFNPARWAEDTFFSAR